MIKRSLAVLLICASMCLALTGCGDDNSYSGHLQTHSIKNTESSPDSSDTQGEQTTTKGSFKWRIVHTSPTTTTTTVSSTTSQTTTTTEQTGGENTAPPETTTTRRRTPMHRRHSLQQLHRHTRCRRPHRQARSPRRHRPSRANLFRQVSRTQTFLLHNKK